MAKAQRKDEILKSELPPSLPLMALRSTIVYPLGTIAVQMGAPENLSLLRAHEESGLIVALVVATVFFLVIVAMLIVVVSKSSGRKPVRHRRRRPLSLDDDDDDD